MVDPTQQTPVDDVELMAGYVVDGAVGIRWQVEAIVKRGNPVSSDQWPAKQDFEGGIGWARENGPGVQARSTIDDALQERCALAQSAGLRGPFPALTGN